MKLLVTGGSGFIGSNFIRYWLNTYPGDTIVNLDKMTYAASPINTADFAQNPRYTFMRGDITKTEDVAQAMEGVEIVVHFAAETHVDNSIGDPDAFFKTNVLGTAMLLKHARRAGVSHFHLVSTDEVFGQLDLGTTEKFSETTPYNPRNPYSASKASADHVARSYFYTYGFPITITNCSNNFGPYQHPEKFIPNTITLAMLDQQIPIYGDGLQVRDWLYVVDHCRAIDMVIHAGVKGETYLVGGMTDDIPNIDVAKKILRIMGKPESLLVHVTDRAAHDRRYAIDWTKINKELGWQPLYDFDTWLEKTIDFYAKG